MDSYESTQPSNAGLFEPSISQTNVIADKTLRDPHSIFFMSVFGGLFFSGYYIYKNITALKTQKRDLALLTIGLILSILALIAGFGAGINSSGVRMVYRIIGAVAAGIYYILNRKNFRVYEANNNYATWGKPFFISVLFAFSPLALAILAALMAR